MSISSTVNRNDYTGDASASVYSYSFRILSQADLKVTVRDTSDVETTLTLTTDYTVSGVGNTVGGSITLVNSSQDWLTGGNLKTGYSLTIRRVRVLNQTTDIRNQGDYFPEAIEDALDHVIFVAQQQQDELDRSMKFSETIAGSSFDTDLPPGLVGQSGVTFITNSSGDAFIVGPSATDISSAQANAASAAASAVAASTSATTASSSAGTALEVLSNANVIAKWGGTASGSANDLILTPSPALSSYVAGLKIEFLSSAANTGASTVNVNSLGSVTIQTSAGGPLQVGDIRNDEKYAITYDGSNFRMDNHITVGSASGMILITSSSNSLGYEFIQRIHVSYMATNGSFTTGNERIVNFQNNIQDNTSGAVTTGSNWAFVVPKNGLYDIRSNLIFGGAGAAGTFEGRIYQNSNVIARNQDFGATTFSGGVQANTVYRLNASDVISIKLRNDYGATLTFTAGSFYSFVTITEL